jgi:negative regulator of flagellin synthesis FlgM
MVRDINGANGPLPGVTTNKNAKGNEAIEQQSKATQPAPAAKPAEPARDVVEISSQAKVMKSLEAKLKELPDVDLNRVEELKSAISEGRYNIDAQSIADRMLQADNDFDFS